MNPIAKVRRAAIRTSLSLWGSILAFTLLFFGQACQHYTIDPQAQSSSSYYIAPVQQESITPNLAGELSRQLRENFNLDPRARLAARPEDARWIVEVTLADLEELFSAGTRDDSGRAASVRQTHTAQVSVFDNRRNQYTVEDVLIESRIHIYADRDVSLQNPRFQSGPAIAGDLADRIRTLVLDEW